MSPIRNRAIMACCAFLLLVNDALASGSTMATIGGTSFTGSTDTGLREAVQLTELRKGAYIGRPNYHLVPLVAVYASPGLPAADVILRAVALSERESSMLLVAPSWFRKQVKQAFIFLDAPDYVLMERTDNRWERRTPESLPVTALSSDAHRDLAVFSVDGLGLYRLLRRDARPALRHDLTDEEDSPRHLLQGGAVHGLRPWWIAVTLFASIALLSVALHALEKRYDQQ